MSEAFSGSITFTADEDGNRRVAFSLSQPASIVASEVLESEDGRSEVGIDIVPPNVTETETHFIEGDDDEDYDAFPLDTQDGDDVDHD